jgi:hypothetical protein
LALSESSDDSMVMYFSPLTLTPFAMTALVSLLSLNEAAMALISAAVSCSQSVLSVPSRLLPAQRRAAVLAGAGVAGTYGEVWRRGPGGLAVDIADEGLVDVARADEAARALEDALLPQDSAVPLINVCWAQS